MRVVISGRLRNVFLARAEHLARRYAVAEVIYFARELASINARRPGPEHLLAILAFNRADRIGRELGHTLVVLGEQGMTEIARRIVNDCLDRTLEGRCWFVRAELEASRQVPLIPYAYDPK